jgi:hypothetical protein
MQSIYVDIYPYSKCLQEWSPEEFYEIKQVSKNMFRWEEFEYLYHMNQESNSCAFVQHTFVGNILLFLNVDIYNFLINHLSVHIIYNSDIAEWAITNMRGLMIENNEHAILESASIYAHKRWWARDTILIPHLLQDECIRRIIIFKDVDLLRIIIEKVETFDPYSCYIEYAIMEQSIEIVLYLHERMHCIITRNCAILSSCCADSKIFEYIIQHVSIDIRLALQIILIGKEKCIHHLFSIWDIERSYNMCLFTILWNNVRCFMLCIANSYPITNRTWNIACSHADTRFLDIILHTRVCDKYKTLKTSENCK